ncbi:MAG: TonB-dependent receptor [Saprospiraceae bacterium]|nr:TonB-dependent receptor [Saprospiraceae bacterium]
MKHLLSILARKRMFLSALALLLTGLVSAQVRISGTVTDAETGEALIGASVRVQGTTNGAITDFNGAFSLSLPDAGATLVVSYTGYADQTVPLAGQTTLNIAMAPNALIEEIVVVGYGVQKKSDLTGSVGTVKSKDIERIPTASVDQALQGKIAGVYVTPASGEPGAGGTVRIRGTGTLNDANPLYVVDGMLLDNASFVNPQDVQSIEVLKDASATAMYGNRGANGVIIITTKKGSKDRKAVFNLNTSYGIQQIDRYLPLSNAAQFAQLYTESTGDTTRFPDPAALGEGTNWQDVIFRDAPMANVQLSVNGSWKKLQYNLSGNYFNQQGIVEETGFDRYTGRFNGEYPVLKNLRVGTNLAYSTSLNNSVGGGVIGSAYRIPPVFSVRDSTGDFTDPTSFGQALGNPAADLFYKNDQHQRRNRWVGTVYGDYNFAKYFTFRSNFGFDRRNEREYYFEPAFEVSTSQRNEIPRTSRDSITIRNWLWENTLTYDREFDKLYLNVLAGQTAQENRFKRRNTIDNVLQPNGERITEWAMMSFLFRTNATFYDRYLVTASLRADGSSRFAKGNRWGYFPSAAVGWNVAQEPFMANQKIFDRLKLRASWGIVGNDKTSEYPSLGVITDELYSSFNDTVQSGATLINYSNAGVTWETARQTDVGLELAVLNGRLTVEADWYNRFTFDILADLPIPEYVGSQATPVVNSAQVRNRGWDFTVNWRETKGKVSYNLGFILSTVDNEVMNLNQAKSEILAADLGQGFATRTVVGQPIGGFYGYKVEGVFQNEDEIEKYPTFGDEQPGDFRYADINGDSILSSEDRTYLGSPIPTLTYGFSAGIEAYGFDFNIDFFGVSGNKVLNAKAIQTRFAVNNWEQVFYDDRWTGEGTSNTVASMDQERFKHNTRVSDHWIEDGSFLRLRSIMLGYTFPKNWLSGIGVSRARLYASGTNLWTRQEYSGWSPEFPGSSPYAVGIDFLNYPMSKTYLFGLDVTF